MSMNNENLAPRWELGDAITIRLDPDDAATTDAEAADPEDVKDAGAAEP